MNEKLSEIMYRECVGEGMGYVDGVVDIEARLEAMERALRAISQLSLGQGSAAIAIACDTIGEPRPDLGSLAAV